MGLTAEICGQVYEIILVIYIFDVEYDNERYKDYDLLVTTTAIALGAYVLDKILNSYPKDGKKVAN
jgi:hypothetical protein